MPTVRQKNDRKVQFFPHTHTFASNGAWPFFHFVQRFSNKIVCVGNECDSFGGKHKCVQLINWKNTTAKSNNNPKWSLIKVFIA